MRSGNGRFRKTTLKDLGINDGNGNGTVYICNICEREFIPIVHSGQCCGVDNKRLKKIILTPEQQAITDQINAINKKPFINRLDLQQIQKLELELNKLKKA